jgi:DNA-binding winged helix-turn-helix (wHTH) protein
MDPDAVSIVREAVRTRLRDETIERSVGRTVRRRGLDFSRYVQVMSDLRDLAKERKSTTDAVAEGLAEEKGEDH